MKFIYWIALIVGGSVLAWFLWRKVNPETQIDKIDLNPFTNAPTGTQQTTNGDVLAFNYKQVPQFGLLKPRVATNRKIFQ